MTSGVSSMQHNDIAKAWANLENALVEKLPLVFENLDAGATEADFKQLENVLEFELPDDFRQFYSRHNGHSELEDVSYGFSVRSPLYPSKNDYLYTDYFLFSLIFMPIYKPNNEDADIWDMSIVDFIQHGLEEELSFTDLDEFDFSGPVQHQLWNPHWIPMCTSGELDQIICADYAPQTGGNPGQVICCKYSENIIQVIADSLADYLQMQAEDLRLGLIKITS